MSLADDRVGVLWTDLLAVLIRDCRLIYNSHQIQDGKQMLNRRTPSSKELKAKCPVGPLLRWLAVHEY
jgi:hypothetical protein